VVGGAHSTYYHLENGRLKGRNVAKGDTIRFAFADGQIDEVLVSGNAHGTYFGRAQVAKRDSLAPAQDSLKQKGKTQ
jgi:allophanate hydrolase subunit 2